LSPAILAVDVAYGEARAAAVGVLFKDWGDKDHIVIVGTVRDGVPMSYEPGAFYKRELPLLLAVIDKSPMEISAIVVDGYVWLGHEGQPGLGAHLYEAIERRTPVIGVAKTKYKDDTWSAPVLRGASKSPLYVTSVGIDRAEAAENVARMSGEGRMPKLLSRADRRARMTLGRTSGRPTDGGG
jgi:deoxyribonuclease V